MNTQRTQRTTRLGALTIVGVGLLGAVGIGWPLPLQGSGDVVVFEAGTVAKAEDVNTNFRVLDTAVVAARGELSTLSGRVDTAAADASSAKSDVAKAATDIDGNKAAIGTNTTNIGSNTTAIGTNTGAIAALTSTVDDLKARLEVVETKFVRAAYSQETDAIDDFSEPLFTPIHTLDVNVPASGILVIMATVSHEWDGESAANSFTTGIHRITVDGTPVSIEVREEINDPSVGIFNDSAVTVTCAAEVTEGTASVALELRKTGSADIFVLARSITTFFLPFGNNGTQGDLGKALVFDPDDRFGLNGDDPQQY